jgi:hypothetical protein
METNNITPENLAGDILGDMPKVTASTSSTPAPAVETPKPIAHVPALNTVEKDASGVPFNPDLHKPHKNRKGLWTKKGVGRGAVKAPVTQVTKPQAPAPTAVPVTPVTPSFIPPEVEAAANQQAQGVTPTATNAQGAVMDIYEAAAELYLRTGYSTMGALVGPGEWDPDSEDEHRSIKVPLTEYLRQKGTVDLTPGQMLAFAITAYSLKRVQKPTTKERLGLLWHRIRGWWNKTGEETQ